VKNFLLQDAMVVKISPQRLLYFEFFRSSRMIVILLLDQRVAFIYVSSLALVFIFFAFAVDVFVANSVLHVKVTIYSLFHLTMQ
jgi:hypothetical protein